MAVQKKDLLKVGSGLHGRSIGIQSRFRLYLRTLLAMGSAVAVGYLAGWLLNTLGFSYYRESGIALFFVCFYFATDWFEGLLQGRCPECDDAYLEESVQMPSSRFQQKCPACNALWINHHRYTPTA